MTSRDAASTRSAAACSPRWRSIRTPDRISAVGFALFWPAYLGAEPWTGSKTAASVADVGARRDAEPADEARRQVAHDVAVQVRQDEHVVQLGLLDELHAHVVDDAVLELDPALVVLGDRPAALEEQAVGQLHDVRLVDGGDLAPAVGDRVLEREPGDPLRGRAGDDLDALRGVRPDHVLDAGVEVLGVLADDDEVDVLVAGLQTLRSSAPAGGSRTGRASGGV